MCAFFLAVILLFSVSPLVAQTTLSGERANNTSAADTFRGNTDGCGGRSPGNPAAWNVSKIPTRSLLYAGAATKVYAHFLPWFCMNTIRDADNVRRDADNVVRCNGHVLTGYDSNDPEQVRRQVEDMISRGLDGMIIDWYGPSATIEEETTQYVRAEAERHPGFEFAIMEDKGAFTAAPDKVAKLIADLNYVADHYYTSPAYMRRNGRPVLFFFVDPNVLRADEWAAVRGAIRGNPLFIFEYRGDDGAFAWIGLNDHPSCDYLDDFYASVPAGKEIFGSAYPGFDDTLAGWSEGRKLDRRCGQTWLCGFESANDAFDAAHPLPNLQLVTWNDYDEGTEIETGIDNCLALTASIDGGGHLHWVPQWTRAHGTEKTIDHYRIFSSADGEHLTQRAELPADARSVDLQTLGLTGTQKLFVQAVGKPSVRNQIVDAGTFSARAVAVAVAVTVGNAITISNPSQCAVVSSPIHVLADETSAATATAMQIYRDGVLVVDRQGVEHLDEFVDAAPGPHQLAVKAWYGATTPGDPVFVDVVVAPTIVISSPAPNATLLSPIHVVADETTSAIATVMQIYLDGVLVLERPGEHLDALVPAAPGAHQIAVKAWYPSCPGDAVTVDVTVVPPNAITISNPSPQCAVVSSPIHVIADETSAATARAMQIYRDGVLFVDRQGVEHLDEFVDAAPGPHQLAVKAWYGAPPGEPVPGDPVFVDVVVAPTIVISSPAPKATLLSPIHVVADENTPATATVMQIYLDGVFVIERPGEHLDELVPADPGGHRIAVKAWYPSCPGDAATVDVTVVPPGPPPVVIVRPLPNAVVSAPIHVVADEITLKTATAMQIYLDGVRLLRRSEVGELAQVPVVDFPTVEHLDELVAASLGYHQIAVKSWYADGTSYTVRVNVLVDSEGAGAPIVIDSPAACATVRSPIHLIAQENTADVAAAMEVYLDGVLIAEHHDVEHLDELIPASPGTHWLAVRAWYAGGRTRLAEVYVTVAASRRRASHVDTR